VSTLLAEGEGVCSVKFTKKTSNVHGGSGLGNGYSVYWKAYLYNLYGEQFANIYQHVKCSYPSAQHSISRHFPHRATKIYDENLKGTLVYYSIGKCSNKIEVLHKYI
jgi:hypothetical protein